MDCMLFQYLDVPNMFITPNSGEQEVKPTVRVYIENSECIEGVKKIN